LNRFVGAVEQNDLEQNFGPELLDELENWSDEISSDPALVRALNALDEKELIHHKKHSLRGPKP